MNPVDESADLRDSDDGGATRRYLDLIDSLHREWDEREHRGDPAVQLSQHARTTIKAAVRADARHGAQVTMPPTELGPYTLSEFALRSLIRSAVDSVDGVVCLRTAFDHTDADEWNVRGAPRRIHCRISVRTGSSSLVEVADSVRATVIGVCLRELALSDVPVDIHIEDLHE